MLPFLKRTQEGGASSVETELREPDEDKEYDAMHSAAQDLIDAIKRDDVKGVAESLRAAFELADSEPHIEGEHI